MYHLRIGIALFVVCLILITTIIQANPFEECHTPLTLSSTTDWYPYIYQQNGESTGVDVELLRRILKQMNCQLEVLHYPERRSMFELNAGNIDIALGASKNKEREQLFHYSTAYRNENNRFAYRRDDNQLAQVNSLQDIIAAQKIIAINLAGWYGIEIAQAKAQYNGFVFSDTVNKRLKMLVYQRVDLVIDDDIVLCSELERSNLQALTLHPLILSSANIHYIFNKQTISKAFIEQFNQILTAMKSSGEIATLYQQQLSGNCIEPIVN